MIDPKQTIISEDIYIRVGVSGYIYISSVSQETTVPVAPTEILPLYMFLREHLGFKEDTRDHTR